MPTLQEGRLLPVNKRHPTGSWEPERKGQEGTDSRAGGGGTCVLLTSWLGGQGPGLCCETVVLHLLTVCAGQGLTSGTQPPPLWGRDDTSS